MALKIVRKVADLRSELEGRIALVPTMGALHEGHLSLIRQAKSSADLCVMSLFINPTQFGPYEDYTRYPRNEERDAGLADSAGADVLFAPTVDEMYPGPGIKVSVPELAALYEGASRPGHFDGVATVVLKLLNLVGPHVAWFGRKDLQQCAVIEAMVRTLFVPVELRFGETVRESDGLAMSSRNVYLSVEERALAPQLHHALCSVARTDGGVDALRRSLDLGRAELGASGWKLDYLDVVDRTFRPASERSVAWAVIGAARLGATRLIDNVLLP